MDAREILEKVLNTYSTARTYSETGRIESDGVSERFRKFSSQRFRTFFIAPNKLRYEYRDWNRWIGGEGKVYRNPPEEGVSVLWSDGENCYRKRFYEDDVRKEGTLYSVLGISTGECPLNGMHTSCLLIEPAVSQRTGVLSIRNAARTEDDLMNGVVCLRITGSILSEEDSEVWIDHADFTIRRVRMKLWFPMMRRAGIDDDVPDNRTLPLTPIAFTNLYS